MPDPADPVFNLVSGGLTGTAPVAWGMLPAASLIVDTEQPLHAGPVTVDVHVRRIRAKLSDLGYDLIQTMRHVGYRFMA